MQDRGSSRRSLPIPWPRDRPSPASVATGRIIHGSACLDGAVKRCLPASERREIGARLGISARTAESHLRRLFERFELASRTELAARALRQGWLEEVG